MTSILLSENFLAGQPPLHGRSLHGIFDKRYGAYRPPLRFLTNDSRSYCESFQADTGLIMLVIDVGLAKPLQTRLCGQNMIEFHYRLAGSLNMSGKWGALTLVRPSMLLWYQPGGYDDVGELVGNGTNRETSISLYCDLGWLSSLAPEYSLWTSDLLSRSRNGATPVFRLYPPLQRTVNILQEIVGNAFHGHLRSTYARGKALELLCQTLRALGASDSVDGRSARLRSRDQRCAALARQILVEEFATPPTIKRLAGRVGINEATLCSAFKQEIGVTISEFVRSTRLGRAKELLVSSDLQVRQVALSVGYAHHSTFTAAFTNHFGISPKAVSRLSRWGEDTGRAACAPSAT